MFSAVGSGMTAFAVGIRVFQESGTVTGFSLIMVSLFLPSVLLKPITGVMADRFDRRALMVVGDAGSAGAVFVLLAIVRGGNWSVAAAALPTCITRTATRKLRAT